MWLVLGSAPELLEAMAICGAAGLPLPRPGLVAPGGVRGILADAAAFRSLAAACGGVLPELPIPLVVTASRAAGNQEIRDLLATGASVVVGHEFQGVLPALMSRLGTAASAA